MQMNQNNNENNITEDKRMGAIIDDFRAFYGVSEMPFSLVPNTHFYLALPSHHECFNMLMFSIASGEGFMKVTGEVGTGKTLLCRRLLNTLETQEYYTAYLPNPRLTPIELKLAIAKELEISDLDSTSDRDLLDVISLRLLDLGLNNKKVILIIDEAQALPEETLEELRLLTNLETESKKLMQIVLFGQPELDQIIDKYHFRQLRQRITFSHKLQALNKKSVDYYVQHRMIVAGYNGEPVFERSAIKLLFKATKGTPRLINIICGKAMLIAFSRGQKKVKKSMVNTAIKDTEGVSFKTKWLAWG
ncbi:MAG: MSHA biogenesis protein MshM [Psychrobacter glaciei]|jgi:MSHA biogenesis protein MshM